MNIVFVSSAYKEPGKPSTGLPNYLDRISHSLVNKGNKVTIIYSAKYNQSKDDRGVRIIAVRVPYLCIKDRVRAIKENNLLASYYVCNKLEEVISEEHTDIIQFASLQGIGMTYNGNVPAVMRLSSYFKTYFSSNQTYDKDIVDAYAECERKAALNMDGVFAPCNITAEAFSHDTGKPVNVIETPFENDVAKPDTGFYEKELKGKKYALFFGSLYAEKGIGVIAEIIHDFLKENEDYYFVAIGDVLSVGGISSDRLLLDSSKDCKERILIYDPISHEKLYPVIRHAQFVVLPSLMDNFPNACIEAMYFRRVVIGTNGASFEQLIHDGENGLLCRIGDSRDLLLKMNEAVSMSDQKRKSMGEMAFRRIQKISPDIITDQLMEYYMNVIKSVERSEKGEDKIESDYYTAEHLVNDYRTEIENSYIKEADKRFLYNRLLMKWVQNLRNGISCADYLRKTGCKKAAVYGVYDVGVMLIDELRDNGIDVVYGVDRSAKSTKVNVCTPDSELPDADIMIVTPVSDFKEIKKSMSGKFKGRIVSLEDIVFEGVE